MTLRVVEEMHTEFPARQIFRKDFDFFLMKFPTEPSGCVNLPTLEEYTSQGWGAIVHDVYTGIGHPILG